MSNLKLPKDMIATFSMRKAALGAIAITLGSIALIIVTVVLILGLPDLLQK